MVCGTPCFSIKSKNLEYVTDMPSAFSRLETSVHVMVGSLPGAAVFIGFSKNYFSFEFS